MKIIRKCYGKKLILEDISFDVNRGEKTAIVGRNGVGKTTLLKIMAGIQTPDEGEISYFDVDVENYKEKIGFLPQINPLVEELSIKDNLWLWNKKGEKSMKETAINFYLDDMMTCKIKNLSGGMKRRVAIACVMQNEPEVLILDEPTASLDMIYKKEIRDTMNYYAKKGVSIIYSTHEHEEIKIADQILLMKDGRTSIIKNIPENIEKLYELMK